MQVFGGSSNPELTRRIAELLGAGEGKIECTVFANGETRIRVVTTKIEKEVVVVQSLSTPTNEHLMEFCLICDALHRGGAREITAVIPWMGYSKQDKVFCPGEPLSAKVVAQIIQVARPSKIVTLDLHNRAALGFFDVPIVELTARPLLLAHFRKQIGEDWVVVAPDAGSVKTSTEMAMELELPIVYIDKKRDLVSGAVKIVGMSGAVAGKTVLMIDDNVFTGATLIETAKALRKAGAKRIVVGLTHHLYVSGVQERIEQSEIDKMVVTDTIARKTPGRKSERLKILSVAGLIVDELRE